MHPSQRQGWHKEDIKAELHKRGWPFARIGRAYGYKNQRTPSDVLRRPWPLMERIVGDILECHPAYIWPERYKADFTPKGRGIKGHYTKLRKVGNSSNKKTVSPCETASAESGCPPR